MKEYKNGFTTKAALDKNDDKKSSFGDEIEVYTENGNIMMRVIGDELEIVNMSIKEAKLLCSMLNDAINKVN